MSITFEFPDGFEKRLVETFARIEGEINDEVKSVINQGLLAIETRAKLPPVPVDTGRLRSSIHAVGVGMTDSYRYMDDEGNGYDGRLSDANGSQKNVGYVGTNVEYAAEQEFGGEDGKRGGHKFLTRASADMAPKIEAELKKIRVK